MKIVNDIFSDLVEKKLWPVAAILVVLIVGVPMQLSKAGPPPDAPLPPAADTNTDTGPELALTRSSVTGFTRAPRVNKKELDPFAERNNDQAEAALKAIKAALKTTASTGSSSGSSDTSTSTGGGDQSVPEAPSDTPKDTTPKTKTETDDLLSIIVTGGDGSTSDPINDIRTLSPLPDATNPFLIYTGKSASGAAVFIVSADVQPSGEGTCDPSPTDCRTLTLAEGQTEDFKLLTSGGSTISITVVGIETKKVTTTGTAARAARLEARGRRVGAKVVSKAIDDPAVLTSLLRHKVRFRG